VRSLVSALPMIFGLGIGVFGGCGTEAGGSGGTGATGGSSGAGTGAVGGRGGDGGSGGGVIIGGASGTGGGPAACADLDEEGTLIPANLLFVIDRSGSMNCNLPPIQSTAECEERPVGDATKGPIKWVLTRDALKQAIQALEAGGNVNAGIDMFPNAGSECAVDSPPSIGIKNLDSGHSLTLRTFLDNVNPKGQTPLAGAAILSYVHLYEQMRTGSILGNKFVVFLTDGFETCQTDAVARLLTTKPADCLPGGDGGGALCAYEQLGIRTFVIGVPGSEDGRATLSELAWLGGAARSADCNHGSAQANVGDCHYDMTDPSVDFASELQKALDAISGAVLSCEFETPVPNGVPDYGNVSVTITGEKIERDDGSCDQADGWQFNADRSKIILCGDACSKAKAPTAKVRIAVPCLPT
jgi:hypothetical protein